MRWLLILCVILCVAAGCEQGRNSAVPELLVYCENGMVAPVTEISRNFKAMYKCRVRIYNDCAHNIISTINYTHRGDVFIPDSYNSLLWLKNSDRHAISDSLYIGTNSLVLIVEKDNPAQFTGKLSSLSNPEYTVTLANPETCSLGFETMQLLVSDSIYSSVIANTITLAVDSRGLIRSIANGESSVTVDWFSNYEQNKHLEIDTFNITQKYNHPEVYAALLGKSRLKGLASSFLATLSSPRSVEIFARYGIKKPRISIFNQNKKN